MAGSGRARSASTGKYVSKATAARHPRTTVTESTSSKGGGGTASRSAITGRYDPSDRVRCQMDSGDRADL